jgi:hypothetical protein
MVLLSLRGIFGCLIWGMKKQITCTLTRDDEDFEVTATVTLHRHSMPAGCLDGEDSVELDVDFCSEPERLPLRQDEERVLIRRALSG